jgi:hypothetical protein
LVLSQVQRGADARATAQLNSKLCTRLFPFVVPNDAHAGLTQFESQSGIGFCQLERWLRAIFDAQPN